LTISGNKDHITNLELPSVVAINRILMIFPNNNKE